MLKRLEMNFDIRTAILGLAVGNLVLGLMLQLFQFGPERPQRIPFLATGKLLQGFGWLLLYERGVLPDWLSFTVGNIALIVGTAYDTWAIYHISQRTVSLTLQVSSTVGIIVLCMLATPLSAAGRIAATSFTVMIFFAVGGYAMLRYSSGHSSLRRHVGWSMWVMVVVSSVRGTWAALYPEHFTLFAANMIQLIMFAALYYLMLTNGFGLLLLAKQKADLELRDSEARFRSYFELPLIGIAITSPDKGWLDVNAKLCAMLGYTKDELMAMTWAELTHPDDLAIDLVQFNRLITSEIEGYDLEKRFVCKDGHTIPTHLAVQCVRHPDRSVHYVVALLEDITERKQTEAALQESETRYQDLYENAPDMYLSVEPQTGRILQCNRTVVHVTGFAKDDLIGLPIFDIYHPDCLNTAKQAMHDFMKTGNAHDVELQICCRDGSQISVSLNVSAVRDATGNIVQSRSSWRDITARKRLEEQLHQQATTDGLTGIINRRRFIELATDEIKRAVRLDHPLALAIMDIDHFKSINDTYGHAIGDHALIALTRICQGTIREIDVLARFGGDEFVVLFPETTAGEAQAVMERVLLALTVQPVDVNGKPVALTISVGVTGLVSAAMSLDAMLDRADQALYQAKQAGRNRVVCRLPIADCRL